MYDIMYELNWTKRIVTSIRFYDFIVIKSKFIMSKLQIDVECSNLENLYVLSIEDIQVFFIKIIIFHYIATREFFSYHEMKIINEYMTLNNDFLIITNENLAISKGQMNT